MQSQRFAWNAATCLAVGVVTLKWRCCAGKLYEATQVSMFPGDGVRHLCRELMASVRIILLSCPLVWFARSGLGWCLTPHYDHAGILPNIPDQSKGQLIFL